MRPAIGCLLVLLGTLALAMLCRIAPADDASDARTPQHPIPWSFKPLGNPTPPATQPAGWAVNSIDAFIEDSLHKHSLTPAPPASKLVLLRRACFDLVGLPPSPKQIEDFANDNRPDAYEHLIDQLLYSPQYGERWARYWLDAVRYADTGGFENDYLYPSAWKYRDYVIRSLNSDKPFDRFIEEQVAGDELWPDDSKAVTATALYCFGPALEESAMQSWQLEYEWLTDSTDTTGAAFLGLTLGCARCHDHKYDPLTQKDYYSMQAIFAASDRPYPEKIRLHRIKALNGLLSDAPVPEELKSDPRCTVETENKTGSHLFHRAEPLEMHVLHRGQINSPREPVSPGVPDLLASSQTKAEFASIPTNRRRAELARWISSPDNPLTARVLVNRVWDWHFGQGIVRTPNDFGAQGEPPTHPELLDWLARDFLAHGWSLKRLHRQIMLSSTYRMQSIASGPGLKIDPENKLLWHFPRHRLEGEAIRDAMLACSGELNLKEFGPPVVPPLSPQEMTGLFNAKEKWPVTKDISEQSRRSVYVLVRRTFQYPFFAAFDAPELMSSCPRRAITIVPTQALTLLNSPLARQQADAFAHRLRDECGDNDQKALARAWMLAFGRAITDQEQKHCEQFLHDRSLSELCLAIFNTNEFVYVD